MLEEFSVKVERALEWGDMDAFNHVNNIIYFRFFENARIAYFDKVGLLEPFSETKIGPILKSTSCIYRFPLVFPDTISVGAKVLKLEEDRFLMKYAVLSHKTQKIAAEGEGVVVSYDYVNFKKAPLPEVIANNIRNLEKL